LKVDQTILAEKIKAAEDRLAYLRSLLPAERHAWAHDNLLTPPVDGDAVVNVAEVKRKPGRPRKAA
jgi:hypothetical protein